MARYLITGGCGFIGSHLVDALLACGHAVRVLDDLSSGSLANLPEDAEFIEGDILDAKLVGDCLADIDGCFHLAAIPSVHGAENFSERTRRVNVDGSKVVFDAVACCAVPEAAMPIVYASSAAVLGEAAKTPAPEYLKPQPISAYGADKRAVEHYARDVWRRCGVPSTGLRLFNVYGPRQDPRSPYSGVISIFMDKLLDAAPVEVFGDGEQVRDFVYVSDAVEFLLAAMAALPAGAAIFNGCTGRGTTINQLYEILQELTGTRLPAHYRPARGGDISISLGDPTAAAQAWSVRAATELRQGLALTLQSHLATARHTAEPVAETSD